MLVALLAMDLVWALGLVGVSIPAASAAFHVFGLIVGAGSHEPWSTAIAFVAACVSFVVVYVASVCLILLLLPNPKAGKHTLLKGRDFYLWSIGFIVRRWLDIPPISTLVRQSWIAKLVSLRAAGAAVHPVANMSSDVVVLDPCMFTISEGAMLGSGVVVAGHMVVDQTLLLAPVFVGKGAEAGADVRLAPGAWVGERAQIQTGVVVGPFVTIGAGAVIGLRAVLGSRVTVGCGAKVAPNVFVPNGTAVPDGGVYPASLS